MFKRSLDILTPVVVRSNALISQLEFSGEPGGGAGKGGGGGGSVRDAGGAFGKREYALEESYFHKKQRELLRKLREQREKLKKRLKSEEESPEKEKET